MFHFYVQKYAKKVCRNMHQIRIICKKKYGNICKNIDSMFKNMQKYAKTYAEISMWANM